MTAIEVIRLVGGEFKGVDNETLEKWIEMIRPMVSRKQFGKLYEQAIAYLVCHKLKMAGFGESPLGKISIPSGIASYSEGSTSISYNTSQQTNVAKDAELGLTIYGTQFLTLRRSVIVGIVSSGEGCV